MDTKLCVPRSAALQLATIAAALLLLVRTLLRRRQRNAAERLALTRRLLQAVPSDRFGVAHRLVALGAPLRQRRERRCGPLGEGVEERARVAGEQRADGRAHLVEREGALGVPRAEQPPRRAPLLLAASVSTATRASR